MAAVTLTRNPLYKSEMWYNGKCGNTIGRAQKISIMRRIDISYTACLLVTHNMSPTLLGLQGPNHCNQYLASHLHKNISFIFITLVMAQMSLNLHGVGIKLNTTQPTIVYNTTKQNTIK